MMNVSELFIYRSENKERRGTIVHVNAKSLHILEQRIEFAQQIQVKEILV